jgi:hypothetical protein
MALEEASAVFIVVFIGFSLLLLYPAKKGNHPKRALSLIFYVGCTLKKD